MNMENTDRISKNQKWPQYLASIACVISTFSAGIHQGWPSPSLPILLSKHHPLHLSSDEASYVTVVSSLGDVIGMFIFPSLCDFIGRKATILLVAVPQICSMLMLHFCSLSKTLLYLARIIGGVSNGACLCILPLYIGEISEPGIRGSLLSLVKISETAGILFIDVIGSHLTIEAASLISLTFPLLFLNVFSFMPESPYYFLMKNKTEDARSVLTKLRHNSYVEEELIGLECDVRRQMSERGTFKDLVSVKANRTALLMATVMGMINIVSGSLVMLSYSQIFFMKTTNFLPRQWASIVMMILGLVSTVLSYFLIDYVGRKLILLVTLTVSATCLSSASVYFFLHDFSSLDLSFFNWVPFLAVLTFYASFSVGIGNVLNCLIGEMFSASVKAKATSVCCILYAVAHAATMKMYQITSDRYGLGVPVAIFASSQWLGLVFCWIFVKETKGRTLEEIQQDIRE